MKDGRLGVKEVMTILLIVLPDGKEKEAVIAAFRRTLGSVRVKVAPPFCCSTPYTLDLGRARSKQKSVGSFCGKKANDAAAARRERQL